MALTVISKFNRVFHVTQFLAGSGRIFIDMAKKIIIKQKKLYDVWGFEPMPVTISDSKSFTIPTTLYKIIVAVLSFNTWLSSSLFLVLKVKVQFTP